MYELENALVAACKEASGPRVQLRQQPVTPKVSLWTACWHRQDWRRRWRRRRRRPRRRRLWRRRRGGGEGAGPEPEEEEEDMASTPSIKLSSNGCRGQRRGGQEGSCCFRSPVRI